jgi:arylsulfatase A-like enzyme
LAEAEAHRQVGDRAALPLLGVYTTDNGAYQYMWPEGGTSPFRGDKGTTWEGGVRVPCLMRWPGAPAGRVSGEFVDMTDLLPTLAAAAGGPDVVAKLRSGATYGERAYKPSIRPGC